VARVEALPERHPMFCGRFGAQPGCVKRVKLIWLALVAALALTAVGLTAASASAAEPEWGHCVSVKSKGHYEDSNCTKEAFTENKKHVKKYKGKFEWDSGAAAACFPQKHGKYKDAGCTELDEKKGAPKGKYEKTGGPKFTGEGGAGILKGTFDECELANGEYDKARIPRAGCVGGPENPHEGYVPFGYTPDVECTSETAKGEAAGTDEVTGVSVRFKGCTVFGEPAETIGLPAGEVQVNPLKGRLGYIKKSTHEVGVLLEPATAKGLFAEFEVLEGAIIFHVGVGSATEGSFYETGGHAGEPSGHDGIISPVTPVDQMTHTFAQTYRAERGEIPCPKAENCKSEAGEVMGDYRNIPSSFEGGQLEELEAFVTEPAEPGFTTEWQSAGEEITNVNTVEGEAEIKG
jgi:hypothetical protein